MKKLLLLSFLFITTNSSADVLHNFAEIKSAITAGKSIRIVIDFTKCSSFKKEPLPSTHIGVFTPDKIQIVDSHIVTSFMHFTLNNPVFPGFPLYEFVTYNISDDNNLNLSYQGLSALNYSPLTKKQTFNCKIDDSVKIFD